MYDNIKQADNWYNRRMDLIRTFYLFTYPIIQPVLWWMDRKRGKKDAE